MESFVAKLKDLGAKEKSGMANYCPEDCPLLLSVCFHFYFEVNGWDWRHSVVGDGLLRL